MEPISKNCNFAIICVEKLEKSKNISIFCNKKNLGRILCFFFFFIHWPITKSHRVWATCVSTSKKGGTQVLAHVNQLRLSCDCIFLPWEFVDGTLWMLVLRLQNILSIEKKNRLDQSKRLFSEKVLYKTNCLICKLN